EKAYRNTYKESRPAASVLQITEKAYRNTYKESRPAASVLQITEKTDRNTNRALNKSKFAIVARRHLKMTH
ncbi:MAG: hypothetical protein K6F53_02205, partial [Lachnospiraceae bacterium]|nr:hypothetical protein [Lachnospiraceae bacterium]